MNETLQSIFSRSSTRKFTTQKVSAEDIEVLKKAALAAPTARNLQELRFAFVEDQQLIARINEEVFRLMDEEKNSAGKKLMQERRAANVFYGAPLVVLISARDEKWSELDAGIAVQTLALTAESLGLGSCIIGMVDTAFQRSREANLPALFSMSEDESFRIAIAIGYKAIEKEPHQPEVLEAIRCFN